MSKDSTQRPRPDSNRGPFNPKSDAVTDWPLRLRYVKSVFQTRRRLKNILFWGVLHNVRSYTRNVWRRGRELSTLFADHVLLIKVLHPNPFASSYSPDFSKKSLASRRASLAATNLMKTAARPTTAGSTYPRSTPTPLCRARKNSSHYSERASTPRWPSGRSRRTQSSAGARCRSSTRGPFRWQSGSNDEESLS